MQRISKIYVSNFGCVTAWYDNFLFELTDPDTGQPTDTVFWLENAGGKTSLLSFIFSCFDPKQERWLQHLQKKNHRFADYFPRDTRPSFLIMEWTIPAAKQPLYDQRLIVGQAVVLKETPERGADVDRWYFAFQPRKGLDVTDIPAPMLGNTPAQTMAEFVQWMHAATKIAGDFYHTKIQDDWIKHLLHQRQIDVELLRMQVDFNSIEGGMEEGFLTFNTEKDLLRRFFTLTLDQDRAATIRQSVATTADRLRTKPKYERRLHQLTTLKAAMVPFSQAADNYEHEQRTKEEIQKEAAALSAAILQKNNDLRENIEKKQSRAAAQDRIATTSKETANKNRDVLAEVEGLQHERKRQKTERARDHAKELLDKQRHLIEKIQAAKALNAINTTGHALSELEATIELEEEGLRPARQQAEIQGTLLSAALRNAEQISQRRREEAQHAQEKGKKLIETIDGQKNSMAKHMEQLSVEKGQLEQFIATYEKQRQHLLEEKIMVQEDTDSENAIKRLSKAIADLQAKLTALRAEQRIQEDTHKELEEKSRIAENESREAETAADNRRKFLDDGQILQHELSHAEILRIAADADDADPDSPALPQALRALISDAHRQISDRDIRLAQLRNDRDSIAETGLAGRNPDVHSTARQLNMLGIRSAQPANKYIADLVTSADQARELIMSDPARYLGLNIAETEWPDMQEALPKLKLNLSAPLTIAPASLTKEPTADKRIVLPPKDDSAYNKEAAQAAIASLDARINNQEKEKKSYEERRDAATEIHPKLDAYRKEFGTAKLKQAQAEMDRHRQEQQAALARKEQFHSKADAARQRAKEAAEQAESIPVQTATTTASIKRLQYFRQQWEQPLSTKSTRLQEIQEKTDKINARIGQLNKQQAEAREHVQNALSDKFRHEEDMKTLSRERQAIQHADPKYPAEKHLKEKKPTLDALRRTYGDALSILNTQEKERLGVLGEKLDHARREYDTAKAAYSENFPHLDPKDLEPLLTADFQGALRDEGKTLKQVEQQHFEAEKELIVAVTEQKNFWEKNKRIPPSPETEKKSDRDLALNAAALKKAIERLDAESSQASSEASRARFEITESEGESAKITAISRSLSAATEHQSFPTEPTALPTDILAKSEEIISRFQKQQTKVNEAFGQAHDQFKRFTEAAATKELSEVEPELSKNISQSSFEPARADRARLSDLIDDRIKATKDTLDSMDPDFQNCAGELYDLTYEGISLLTHATTVTMPKAAPYVGGKPILKMKASFAGIPVPTRKEAIRRYLNSIIDSTFIPERGSDIIADCVLTVSGRPQLGLEVLKMEQNEAYQYQSIENLKSSGGQGTIIAMFLYLLISQLRADTRVKVKKAGGGPLILDNPFARVQTRTLIDAQRLLAREIGVQLIFFTANVDYNINSAYKRVIRLRKTAYNTKTKRSHIEMASATFQDLTETQASKP